MLRKRELVLLIVASMLGVASAASGCRAADPAQTPADQGRESAAATQAAPPAPPTASPVSGEPPLTRAEVRLVVRSKMKVVRACFSEALSHDPELGGRVVLRFTIGAEGRAGGVEVTQDEVGAGAATCLSEAVASWQFPRPRGGQSMTLSYPFVFSSEQSLRAAGLPRVEGTVKPSALGQVFDARQAELDECLPEGGKGQVELAFLLDDRGQVTKLSIVETNLEGPVAACLGRAVSSWRFPPAAKGDEARVNHELRW